MSAATLDIAHVVENLERGGLERMVIDLVMAQREAGHRCRVACLYEAGALAPELTTAGIEVQACEKRGGADVSALRRLRGWLRAVPGAVLHTHNANAHYHAVLAAVGLPPMRVINTRHGMGATKPRSRGEWLYRRAMSRTDSVAAVCEAARQRFAAQGVRPRKGLIAVPNGIRIDRFSPADAQTRAALRSILGFTPETRLIGTVGRLNPIKDQSMLLRAFARLHAECADTGLVLVGDGPLRAELEAETSALGIGAAVRFLGDRDDVRRLLPGFDLFALSSKSEGYSMALLEACASGLPIVATDVGGNREIVVDGRNGRVVPSGATEAFSGAMKMLIGDAAEAARMGAASREWALREASIATMADRYAALYRGEART